VIVHIHDIFLPYEYDPYLYQFGAHFNEQYLLQALLTENSNWTTLISACALVHDHRSKLAEMVPRLADEPPGLPGFEFFPSSWWMRRTAAPAG
jgi:hypothetical protein